MANVVLKAILAQTLATLGQEDVVEGHVKATSKIRPNHRMSHKLAGWGVDINFLRVAREWTMAIFYYCPANMANGHLKEDKN